jgi:hypothetical protein
MNTWLEAVYGQFRGVVGDLGQQLAQHGVVPLLRPVAPFNEPAVLAPVVAGLAIIGFFFFSGVAISAFATLIVALLVLYLVLAEVFGFSFEFVPLRVG